MNYKNAFNKNRDRVCFLTGSIKDNEGSKITIPGSGFVVAKESTKYVVTTLGVSQSLEKTEDLKVAICISSTDTRNTYEFFGISLRKSKIEDKISVYKIDDSNNKITKFFRETDLSEERPITGEEGAMIGFPLNTNFIDAGLGVNIMMARSMIGAVKYNPKSEVDFIEIDTYPYQGFGGAPFLVNEKIAGIVIGHFNQFIEKGENIIKSMTPAMGLVQPATKIKKILESIS
jgi:hypothetical protein